MLWSPDGLMLSRFIVDIAEAMCSELTEDAITNWDSQPERGGNNPFDARLNCGVNKCLSSQHELSPLQYGGGRARSPL